MARTQGPLFGLRLTHFWANYALALFILGSLLAVACSRVCPGSGHCLALIALLQLSACPCAATCSAGISQINARLDQGTKDMPIGVKSDNVCSSI